MAMIDLDNFEKLTPEMQAQFAELLKQHPQLESKLKGPAHELNTPTKLEKEARGQKDDPNLLDYSQMSLDDEDEVPRSQPHKPPTLRVQNAGPSAEELEKEEKAAQEKERRTAEKEAAESRQQTDEVANFSPEGKQHPLLKKLRASLGLKNQQKPVVAEIGGLKYEMVPLMREGMTKAVNLAIASSTNDAEFVSNQDIAVIAFSVQTIDSVPLTEVFSVPATRDGTELLDWQRTDEAAAEFFTELRSSPPELSEMLIAFYQQEFPPINLLGKGRVTALCPEANCRYTRIVEEGTDAYCPYHGAKLAREDQLPNPF